MRALLLLFVFITTAYADEMRDHHQDGKSFAQQQSPQSAQSIDASVLPDYFTSSPQELNLRAQHFEDALNQQEHAERELVQQSFEGRPRFVLDNDPSLQNAFNISQNPAAVMDESGCVQVPESCETSYENRICEEALHTTEKSCTKRLIVEVRQPPPVRKEITVKLGVYNYDTNVITVDMKSGRVLSITGDKAFRVKADVILSERLDKRYCNALRVNNVSTLVANVGNVPGRYSPRKVKVFIEQTPTCGNNLIAKFRVYKKHSGSWRKRGGIFIFRIQHPAPKIIAKEYWQNGCLSIEQSQGTGLCQLADEECVEGPETRNISGMNVHRQCWKKQFTYKCQHQAAQNNCDSLRQQGCEQVDSKCLSYTSDGTCAVFQQSMRCPKDICSTETKTICGGKAFCLDGNCGSLAFSPNQDFQRATTALSVLRDAAKDFDKDLNQVFKGKNAKCAKQVAGFKDCCKDDGWGIDLSLAQCKSEEKQLAEDKSNGLCHYVGKYCSKEVLGRCVERKKSYCCFGSKLGRIVQVAGRQQLSLDWGRAKAPACEGLTPEQLQKIDFSQMDLSEFYSDMQNRVKLPNESRLKDRITERVNGFYQEAKP